MGGLGRPIFQTIPNLFRIQSPQAPIYSGLPSPSPGG